MKLYLIMSLFNDFNYIDEINPDKVITDCYSGDFTNARSTVDASTTVTIIYTSNCNVTLYDYNNVPYTTEHAGKMTKQSVTGSHSSSTSSMPSKNNCNVISFSSLTFFNKYM